MKQNKCDLCEYTASSYIVLKRHVTMKHKKEVQFVDIPTQFKCEICPHENIPTTALNDHISIHHEFYYSKQMASEHISHLHYSFQSYNSFHEPYDGTTWISRQCK